MATIDSAKIIREMLDNDGVYPGDPQCLAIYEYTNDWKKKCWSVCYEEMDLIALHSSPFVHNLRLLWSQEEGHVGEMTNEA